MKKPSKSSAKREQDHAQMRHLEVQLENSLKGLDELVRRLGRSIQVRDCQTARMNAAQAELAFDEIRRNMDRVQKLHRSLKLPPGSVDVYTPPAPPEPAPPAPKPAPKKSPPKPAAKNPGPPAKKGRR